MNVTQEVPLMMIPWVAWRAQRTSNIPLTNGHSIANAIAKFNPINPLTTRRGVTLTKCHKGKTIATKQSIRDKKWFNRKQFYEMPTKKETKLWQIISFGPKQKWKTTMTMADRMKTSEKATPSWMMYRGLRMHRPVVQNTNNDFEIKCQTDKTNGTE